MLLTGLTILESLNSLLKNQKVLLLAEIEKSVPPNEKENFAAVKENWDSFTEGMNSLLTSDLKDLKSLKAINIAETVKNMQPQAMKAMAAVAEMKDNEDFENFKNTI